MMRGSVEVAPLVRRWMIGDAAIVLSSVSSGFVIACRLTTPTDRRGPASGITQTQPSGTIRILMLPLEVSSSKISGASPSK